VIQASERVSGSPGGRTHVGLSASQRDRSLLLLGLAAVLASFAIAAARFATLQLSLVWGVVAVLTSAGASLFAVFGSPRARRASVFLPTCFISLWAVGFGLASLVWMDPYDESLTLNRGLHLDSIPSGLAVAAGALLAWSVGYCFLHLRLVVTALSRLRRWSTHGGRQLGRPYSVKRIMILYALGLGARLALLALGRYSYITSDLQGAITQSSPITSVLNYFEFLTTVSLLLLAHVTFRRGSTMSGGLLAAVLMIEIPFGLLSGMRSFIVLRLVAVCVIYLLAGRRTKAYAIVALLGIFAFLSPFTYSYRTEVRSGGETAVDAAGAAHLIPTVVGSTISAMSPVDIVIGPMDFITQRLRFVDEVAMVWQKVPSEIDFIPPLSTLTEASTVLVPRAVWHGKPVYTLGLEYARDFWSQPASVISSRSPTFPGEAFYRGGWGGVTILMLALGALMAAISSALNPRLHPTGVPLFVVAWTELMNVEGSLVLLGAGLTQSLLISAAALRWASNVGRVSKEPASGEASRRLSYRPYSP
jgi:hypothetical protein